MKRMLLASAAMTMLAGLTTAGQRRLTLSEAQRLVRAAISEEVKGLPGFHLEPPPTARKTARRSRFCRAKRMADYCGQ